MKVKGKIMQDLMPISDDYVLFSDFKDVRESADWKMLISKMRNLIDNTLTAVERHAKLSKHTYDIAKGKDQLARLEQDHIDRKIELKTHLKKRTEKRRLRKRE